MTRIWEMSKTSLSNKLVKIVFKIPICNSWTEDYIQAKATGSISQNGNIVPGGNFLKLLKLTSQEQKDYLPHQYYPSVFLSCLQKTGIWLPVINNNKNTSIL